MISLGLLPCFPIRIALVIEADTPIYWLNKVVRFWMSSFFLACASVKFDSGTLCTIRFCLLFSFSFSSNMMSAVIEAIDLTDKLPFSNAYLAILALQSGVTLMYAFALALWPSFKTFTPPYLLQRWWQAEPPSIRVL